MKYVFTGIKSILVTLVFICIFLILDPFNPPSAKAQTVTESVYEIYQTLLDGETIAFPKNYPELEQPVVYLTFDDGPSPLTTEVLNILKEEQVPATFFVLGQAAETYPELLQQIVEQGHAVGNHTYNHHYEDLYKNFNNYWEQIRKTEKIIEDITGIKTTLVRTPGGSYGHLDPFYLYLMNRGGYQLFDWNVDSGDSKELGVPAADIIAAVKNAPLKDEMHVLMHDSGIHEETVRALPEIIHYFKDLGYTFSVLTPDTKPVQHSFGQLKHDRDTDWEQFKKLLQMVVQEQEIDTPQTDPEFPSTPKPNLNPPLNIHFPYGSLELEANNYLFKDGRFHVPLRTMQEKLGGTIYWKSEDKAAVVQMGLQFVKYDVDDRTVTFFRPINKHHYHWFFSDLHFDGEQVMPMYSISIMDGMLMVPIREWADHMNVSIKSYTIQQDKREVRLDYSARL